MDKTAFRTTSFKETDDHVAYWRDKSYRERLEAAWFLIKHAYGIDDDTRMDKTVFECRKDN